MSKFLQKTTCIALALTALALTACSEEATGVLPPYGGKEGTGSYLAQSGKTDYVIAIADDASEYETFAAPVVSSLANGSDS